jgi:molecular chaperone DnaK
LSRSKFEEVASSLITAIVEPMAQALKDADLKPEDIDKIILVGGSTRIPAVQNALVKFFKGKAPDRSINPDEAVALGAAIQAGVLGGEVDNLLLLDVTPLSLGIETLGEVFTKIIERNTTIPTSKAQVFSTAIDGQISVEIHVLQGERAMARDNKSLGKFLLTGLPPAARGVPQIEVAFEIDVNGILQVSAQDKGTGREQSVRITNTGGLSLNEVEKMRQEAEKFAEEDKKRIELVGLRNQADNLLLSYDSTLKDNASLIGEQVKSLADEKASELKAVMGDVQISVVEFQQRLDNFQQTLFSIGAEVYNRANSQPGEVIDFTSGSIASESGEINNINANTPPQFNFDFEDESSPQGDYEVID